MYTVLYIEDEPTHREIVSRLFRRQPELRLILAHNGTTGLVYAQIERPDLILLDLHLPDMSGEAVLHELKSNVRTLDIPVLILTTASTPQDIKRVFAAGARGYFTKPVDLRELLMMIDEIQRDQE